MATQQSLPGTPMLSAGKERFGPGGIIDIVTKPIFKNAPLWWWVGFLVSVVLLLLFLMTLGHLVGTGVGIWDNNNAVVWATDIVNLVFWIGIGHAGTFISAFLLLMRQHWRSAFSRFAEAMTLFALVTAGLFPIFHTGRPWFAYWVAPYPNQVGLNPQWTSALPWDLVAISTYGIISLVFWYIDLLPDLASLRDRAKNPAARLFYGSLAMGWRGESTHWQKLQSVSQALAGLATPLVISVHSVIAMDFA
ncbi:MAG: polysulfide reductase NrfD, partial [Anaerolineae bacterium]|nr:polysulfide reductase NrfD [Anaerolineae bacterium]